MNEGRERDTVMPITDSLSDREQEVVRLLLEGKSNKMIAAALHITERTVEFHLKNIYTKLGVGSRVELILKLRQSTVASAEAVPDNRDQAVPTREKEASTVWSAAKRLFEEMKMTVSMESTARDANSPMTFWAAIRVCLVKYADFHGRASRAEFWWFFLFITLVGSAFALIHETLRDLFLIAMLLPLLAAGARRLRDSGYNPWWELFLLVPVGGLVLLAFYWAEQGHPPVSEPPVSEPPSPSPETRPEEV